MEKLFITSLTIESVRHLKDITIPLSEEKPKHLILTGRNGSGKTSVLEALASYLNSIKELDLKKTAFEFVKRISKSVVKGYFGIENSNEINNLATNYESSKDTMIESGIAVDILFSQSLLMLIDCFKDGEFILAYYKAERSFNS